MTRQACVIAAALLFLPMAAGDADEIKLTVQSRLPEPLPSSREASGLDGLLSIKLAQVAATLNAERESFGLSLDGTLIHSLLGHVTGDDHRLPGRIDRLKRGSVGLRFNGGGPEKESELELRFPLSRGVAVVSGYEASRLDLGLTGTEGDVAHEFKIGASLRF